MKPKLLLCLALVLDGIMFGGLNSARADVTLGADRYVANAVVIELVRAQRLDRMASFLPPHGQQRVFVEAVLKGVDTAQEFLLPEQTLKPGQKALVLLQYKPLRCDPDLSTKPDEQPSYLVWPMNSTGNVNTHGVPLEAVYGFLPSPAADQQGINVGQIQSEISASNLEQVGLNEQVINAVLFPQRFKRLAHKDPSRAVYVRFVVAILDLDRDVPALSKLLESRNKEVRLAAAARLIALTGVDISAPKDTNARSLHEWAQAWAKQQKENEQERWPPVPESLRAPAEKYPGELLQALQNDDADAFAKAFANWLDSGVMRDRNIHYAETLKGRLIEAYLPTAPQLRPDALLDTNVLPKQRMRNIALLAGYYDYNQFAKQRADAVAFLNSKAASEEMLRRAAFWELRDANIITPGLVALDRLAGNDDEYRPIGTSKTTVELNRLAGSDSAGTQRILLRLCLGQPLDDDLLQTIRIEIKAGRQTFINGLFDYLRVHRAAKARWIGRLLCQEKQAPVIPIMLAWLKDPDPRIRQAGAFNLCWIPNKGSVPDLLAAIHSEEDPAVRGQMLEALAQTGDERGLETLLAAAREPYPPEVEMEIARGLGRIRNPKALTTLADMVSRLAWLANGNLWDNDRKAPPRSLNLLFDAANSFGYISHAYKASRPAIFWISYAIGNQKQLKSEVADIEQWRKSQSSGP